MTYVCRLEYKRGFGTYVFWTITFFATTLVIRLIHEFLHGFFAVITGGSFGRIYVVEWILFYPIFAIDVYGGNPILVTEGTLIATWLIALIIVIVTSYPFLRLVMNDCDAANLSGKLFGVRLGAIFEMFGQAVYSLPNFILFVNGEAWSGDGTYMAFFFQQLGYPMELQYVISLCLFVGAFFTLYWSLECDPQICSCAFVGGVAR